MNICCCEIEKRWPESATARMDMLIELDKRGLIRSYMANQHNKGYERVWTKA